MCYFCVWLPCCAGVCEYELGVLFKYQRNISFFDWLDAVLLSARRTLRRVLALVRIWTTYPRRMSFWMWWSCWSRLFVCCQVLLWVAGCLIVPMVWIDWMWVLKGSLSFYLREATVRCRLQRRHFFNVHRDVHTSLSAVKRGKGYYFMSDLTLLVTCVTFTCKRHSWSVVKISRRWVCYSTQSEFM